MKIITKTQISSTAIILIYTNTIMKGKKNHNVSIDTNLLESCCYLSFINVLCKLIL